MKYSKGAAGRSSMVFEMRMGMVNRGAFLGWLSQYPDEAEILLPPLLALEMIDMHERTDGTIVCTVALNCNLQSKTIEQVLAIRKRQCEELVNVVERGIERDLQVARPASINESWLRGLQAEAQQKAGAITDESSEAYNDNARFTEEVTETVRLVPLQFEKWNVCIGITVDCVAGIPAHHVAILAGPYTVSGSAPFANNRPHFENGFGRWNPAKNNHPIR